MHKEFLVLLRLNFSLVFEVISHDFCCHVKSSEIFSITSFHVIIVSLNVLVVWVELCIVDVPSTGFDHAVYGVLYREVVHLFEGKVRSLWFVLLGLQFNFGLI
jgi:hypothetical protein